MLISNIVSLTGKYNLRNPWKNQLSGATIWDTLIGVLRPLFKTQTPDKTAKPTKAHGLLLIQRRGKDSKKHSMRPIRIPSNPRNDLRLARGYLSGPLGNLRLARG